MRESQGRTDEAPDGHPAITWATLAVACVRNGYDLIDDARVLLDAGTPGRAFALSVLALEELGKGVQAMRVLTSAGDEDLIQEYRKLASRHEPKITSALLMSAVLDDSEEFGEDFVVRVKALVRRSASTKMRGFYVDLDGQQVRTPRDISREMASEALDVSARLARELANVLELNPATHAVALWTLGPRVSAQLDAVSRDLEASHPATTRAIRQTIRQIQSGDLNFN